MPRQTSTTFYPPGKGPNDLCFPAKSGSELRALAELLLHSKHFPLPGLSPHLLFAVHRSMGMPRAWQLGGVNDLNELPSEAKEALRGAANKVLDELESGHKYLFIREPHPNVPIELLEKMDLTNEETTEKFHWFWTMPVAFVERIANLPG